MRDNIEECENEGCEGPTCTKKGEHCRSCLCSNCSRAENICPGFVPDTPTKPKTLSDAFSAGCEVGFTQALEGAKNAAREQHCGGCENAIGEICGPNGFAVMAAFAKWKGAGE